MPKALCIGGAVIAVFLFVVFGLDLVTSYLLDTAFPFGGVSKTMDVGFVLAAGALGYASWRTLREQV